MIRARPHHQRSIDAFFAANQLLPKYAIETRHKLLLQQLMRKLEKYFTEMRLE
jgi:hypothetical protein